MTELVLPRLLVLDERTGLTIVCVSRIYFRRIFFNQKSIQNKIISVLSENSKFETKNAELPKITTKTDDHLLATVEPEIMLEPSPLEPIVTNADPAEKTRRRGFFVPDEPDGNKYRM